MKPIHIAFGVVAITLNSLAFLYGAWCYRQARASRWFWRLLRAGQLSILLEAGLGGIDAINHKIPHLHLLYGLLPVLVSFMGESLRISSATMILDARGLESAQEVGELEEVEQRRIVVAIVQREIGVMTLAALVIVGLLIRAATTG
jgi:hypothetical protein